MSLDQDFELTSVYIQTCNLWRDDFMLAYGMFLQMLHADWAIVLFLVLSELKNNVTSNKLRYISYFTLLFGGLYIQGKSTKNTVNRVRLGPLAVEVFVVK